MTTKQNPNISRRTKIGKNDIFDPKASIKSLEPDRDFGREPSKNVICYTIIGKHSYLDASDNPVVMDTQDCLAEDNPLSFAKSIEVDGDVRYFIKVGNNHRLINPIGISDENTQNNFDNKSGKSQWRYRLVDPRAFSLYQAFLRTKNIAFHMNAEREIF